MEKHTALQRPYSTTNEPLAAALTMLGVPAPKDDNGHPQPTLNTYNVDILRGIETARARAGEPPLGLVGKPLEDAVRLAYRAGEKGKVDYLFEKTPVLHMVVEAWSEQSAIIEALEREARAPQTKSGTFIGLSHETAAKLLCQYAKMRQDFSGSRDKPPLWMSGLPLAESLNLTTRGTTLSEAGSVTEGSVNTRSVRP